MAKFGVSIHSIGFRQVWLAAAALFAAGMLAAVPSRAQTLPVTVDASGDTATIGIPLADQGLADLTISFDDATGLTPASLGVSAKLVNLSDPLLLLRLPDLQLTQLDSALPLLVTIEPPSDGGLAFQRTVRVEFHTHALTYTAGSSYRLFKAPLGGEFRDITDEIAPGSVRARGTTGGFSQFLVLADLRETDDVIAQKTDWLRDRIAMLPSGERDAFDDYLDTAEAAVASGDYANAIAALDLIRSRAAARAGTRLDATWSASGATQNHAGELSAGAATLKFSVAYLRDFGQ